MSCDERSLKEVLFEALSDETGIAGVPLQIVVERMSAQIATLKMKCNNGDIIHVIQEALDAWEIDKTLDEIPYKMMKELGIPVGSGFVWHLKALSKEKSEFYRSLEPAAKALIKLLREQNEPNRCGEIPREIAIKTLVEKGFSEEDVNHIYVKDTIDEYCTSWGDDSGVWTYGLVDEHRKTEEYKQWYEESMRKASEKEAMRYRFTEECETIDPIHGRLDGLAEKRGEDLEKLELRRDMMSREEYLQRKKAIEERDADEEAKWNRVIEMVPTLPFDVLIDLRNLLWEGVPPPDDVLTFLDMKLSDKEDS